MVTVRQRHEHVRVLRAQRVTGCSQHAAGEVNLSAANTRMLAAVSQSGARRLLEG